MVNDAIRIGLEENVTSLKSLSLKAYHQLSPYDVPSYYKLCAISSATGILRNYRKALRKNANTRTPYARRLVLTTCYGFKVEEGKLRLPLKAHLYEYLPLNPHTEKVLNDSDLTIQSVTLTERSLSLTFSKETGMIEPRGGIGIDRNLDNVTLADSNEGVVRHDLRRATEVKMQCRETRGHFKRNDVRVRKRIFGKYGQIERDRVLWILHNVSATIVGQAKLNGMAIVMEDIKGIRKLYRKGNGQGNEYRSRMNSWSFYELQRQIEYKANLEGIPVIYVTARGTSANCSICGSRTCPNGQRTLFCARCGISIDRDVNAARNILGKAGLRFSPLGEVDEAMKGNPTQTVIPRADASQVAQGNHENDTPTSYQNHKSCGVENRS